MMTSLLSSKVRTLLAFQRENLKNHIIWSQTELYDTDPQSIAKYEASPSKWGKSVAYWIEVSRDSKIRDKKLDSKKKENFDVIIMFFQKCNELYGVTLISNPFPNSNQRT